MENVSFADRLTLRDVTFRYFINTNGDIVSIELYWCDVVSEADRLQHIWSVSTAALGAAIRLHSDQQ